MSSREIALWIDERWYDALERHLPGGNLQEKMEETLDELINETIPEQEYTRISAEIARERAELEQEREAARCFSVFLVTERGEQNCYLVDEPIDFLRAARSLRRYLKADNPATDFHHYYAATQDISGQEFAQYALERQTNPRRVAGVFEIDLDRGEFTTLDANGGWTRYTVKDVCSAAYKADRKQHMAESYYQQQFASQLVGKELPAPALPAPTMAMEQTM